MIWPNTLCSLRSSSAYGDNNVSYAVVKFVSGVASRVTDSTKIPFKIKYLQCSVRKRWQTLPQPLQVCEIHARAHHARPARQSVEHHAPRIDNHRITVRFTPIDVISALRRRQYIRQI